MAVNVDVKRVAGNIIWWGGVIGLLFLSQARIELFLSLLQGTWLRNLIPADFLAKDAMLIANVITPVRGILLQFSLIILFYPVFQSVRYSKTIQASPNKLKLIFSTLLLFLILCIIFEPGRIGGLAQEYSNSSNVMFTRGSTVNLYRRFLMPALANILFFRGDLFFLIFSFLCVLVMLYALQFWFEANQVQVSLWQLVSLGTISFIFFQIQAPGYPDVLVNIFILLAFILAADTRTKLSLFVLSLAAHEGSLIIWLALALSLFVSKEFIPFLVIGGIYLFLLFSLDGGVGAVMSAREFGGTSNVSLVLNNPVREIVGIFFSFKALWAVVIGAIVHLTSKKEFKEGFYIVLILAGGFMLTFLGVDISRLFGWAFMAVLISWKLMEAAGGQWKKLLHIALIINILIPSYHVYMYGEPQIAPGLYEQIFNLLSNFLQ